MDEVLSQSQIDALLKGINEETSVDEAPKIESINNAPKKKTQDVFLTKKIKSYDFKSPKKFTKEQLRLLDRVYESFARVLSSYLTSSLRFFCAVEVIQIEEQRYFEFSNALPDSTIVSLIDMDFEEENDMEQTTIILNAPMQLGYFFIERLLGGTGETYNLERNFTDIEIEILRNVFSTITGFVGEVFSNNLTVKTNLRSIEDNPRTAQTFSGDNIVIIISLEITIKSIEVPITVCMPAVNLEKIIKNFDSKYEKIYKKPDPLKDEKRKNTIQNSLLGTELEIKAILDETSMDVNDILNLQKDDVILLNKNINSDVKVTINDVPWFMAQLGTKKHKKAIKINKMY